MFSARKPAVALVLAMSSLVALFGCASVDDEVINPRLHILGPGQLDGIAPPDGPDPSVPQYVPGPKSAEPGELPYLLV